MVKRVNSIVDIANGTKKFAIAKVLEKRDKTAQQASSQSNSALGVWHGMAPKGRTGQMVSGVSVKHGNITRLFTPLMIIEKREQPLWKLSTFKISGESTLAFSISIEPN